MGHLGISVIEVGKIESPPAEPETTARYRYDPELQQMVFDPPAEPVPDERAALIGAYGDAMFDLGEWKAREGENNAEFREFRDEADVAKGALFAALKAAAVTWRARLDAVIRGAEHSDDAEETTIAQLRAELDRARKVVEYAQHRYSCPGAGCTCGLTTARAELSIAARATPQALPPQAEP